MSAFFPSGHRFATQRRQQSASPVSAQEKKVRDAYLGLLRELGRALHPDLPNQIAEAESCTVGGIQLAFDLEPQLNRINIYADIGKPDGPDEHRAYKAMLQIQLQQKSPAVWILGLHPDSGRAVLVSSYFVGGEHPDEGLNFPLHLEMCARAAQGLRAHLFPPKH